MDPLIFHSLDICRHVAAVLGTRTVLRLALPVRRRSGATQQARASGTPAAMDLALGSA